MSISSRRRRLAVSIGVAAAVLAPAIQQAGGFGMSQSDFAAQGNSTLRAAGYAFSIWIVIYLALGGYAVYQSRVRESHALRALAWPAAVASAASGAWVVAAAANQMWLTVLIIAFAAVAAVVALLRAAPEAMGRDRIFALTPIALLAGWLTLAAPLNLITAATATGLVSPASAPIWAVAGLALMGVVGAAVALRARSAAYPLPIAWGLAAVYVAERSDKPAVALATAAAAAFMLALAFMVGFRRRRRRSRVG